MEQEPLTAGEIAKYCHVTHRTVGHWISSGKLQSYRTPGHHIRVKRQDFLDFLQKYGMPVPKEFEGGPNGKPRILIVEDDTSFASTLKRLLVAEDKYEVEIVTESFLAGSRFMEFKPDLITLDLRMPGINGFDVCRQIREEIGDKNVKIIVVSGTIENENSEEVMNLGANAFLSKPFERKEFIGLVEKWLAV